MLTIDEFHALLKAQGTLIIDGALATELERRDHDLNHPLWSAKILEEDPIAIKQVHLDYFRAGADIAITASYQASIEGFEAHLGLDEKKATALTKRSVTLARLAREESYGRGVRPNAPLLIAGSVGPYGAYLADGSEYRGDYRLGKSELQDFHRNRIQALVEAEVDLLALETMPQYMEIEALLELLQNEFPSAIAWISCTLKDAEHISDGTPVRDVIQLMEQHRTVVCAFGFNCVPAHLATKALYGLQKLTDIPLLVYPNSGEEWDASAKTWSGDTTDHQSMERQVRDWQDIGVRLIGGCCRTTPDHILAVARALEK